MQESSSPGVYRRFLTFCLFAAVASCGEPARVEAPLAAASEDAGRPRNADSAPDGGGVPHSTTQPRAAKAEAPDGVAWRTDEGAARVSALDQSKPAVIEFHAAWCAACGELARQTWADADVRRESRRFVAIRLDLTDDQSQEAQDSKRRFAVVGLPTILFLDSKGSERARITEFVAPSAMVETMRKVR